MNTTKNTNNTKKITATITANEATINAFNGEDVITIKTNVSTAKAEAEAIAFCEAQGLTFCEVIALTPTTTAKYELDEEVFYAKAIKADKRPQGAYISRTFKMMFADVMVYNATTHKAEVKPFIVRGDNPENIMKRAKAVCRTLENLKPLKVMNYTTTEQLYIMPLAQFIELASKAE